MGVAPVEMTEVQKELDRIVDEDGDLTYVVKNPNVHPSTLYKLTNCQYDDILHLISMNPRADSKTLDKLTDMAINSDLNDGNWTMGFIAEHPNTSSKTLDKMVGFDNNMVKWNPNDPDVSDFRLLEKIASNPNASTSTLEKLSKYNNENESRQNAVRKMALNTLKSKTFDLTKLSPELR